MIDPLTIAAIRRASAELSESQDEAVAHLGGLVALLVDAMAGSMQDHNFALEKMLLLIESQTTINAQIHRRLAAIERMLDERGAEDDAGGPDPSPAGPG